MYRALSFKAAVAPQLLDLSVVVKLTIKEMNSETCTLVVLQIWYQSEVMISVMRYWSMKNGELGS